MGEVTNAIQLALADQEIYDEVLMCADGGATTLEFINDGQKYVIDDTKIVGGTYDDTTLGELKATGQYNTSQTVADADADPTAYLAKRLDNIIGTEVKFTSRTHRTDNYIVTIDFGSDANDYAVSVAGDWKTTGSSASGSGSGSSTPTSHGDVSENYITIDGIIFYVGEAVDSPEVSEYLFSNYSSFFEAEAGCSYFNGNEVFDSLNASVDPDYGFSNHGVYHTEGDEPSTSEAGIYVDGYDPLDGYQIVGTKQNSNSVIILLEGGNTYVQNGYVYHYNTSIGVGGYLLFGGNYIPWPSDSFIADEHYTLTQTQP